MKASASHISAVEVGVVRSSEAGMMLYRVKFVQAEIAVVVVNPIANPSSTCAAAAGGYGLWGRKFS